MILSRANYLVSISPCLSAYIIQSHWELAIEDQDQGPPWSWSSMARKAEIGQDWLEQYQTSIRSSLTIELHSAFYLVFKTH